MQNARGAKMNRYIDADKTLDELDEFFDTNYWGNTPFIDGVVRIVNNQKPADVAPVVRCKDCVFCDKCVAPGKGVAFICSQWFGEEVEENHFCSYGKMDEGKQ